MRWLPGAVTGDFPGIIRPSEFVVFVVVMGQVWDGKFVFTIEMGYVLLGLPELDSSCSILIDA